MNENNTKLFIPVILGTNRDGRQSEHAAKWLIGEIEKRDDIETQLFDVREFKLPEDDYGQAIKEDFSEYRDAVLRADGLIIVSPEYNHGYPGRLKSVLDLLLPEYGHRAVAFVGVSAGPFGGARVIEALNQVVRELGLVSSSKDLNFIKVQDVFDESGALKNPQYEEFAKGFFYELVWLAKTLRWGRENL